MFSLKNVKPVVRRFVELFLLLLFRKRARTIIQIIRPTCVGSYCRKRTGNVCNSMKGRNKNLACRGKLRDTILDWEDPLPELALKLSEQHCA